MSSDDVPNPELLWHEIQDLHVVTALDDERMLLISTCLLTHPYRYESVIWDRYKGQEIAKHDHGLDQTKALQFHLNKTLEYLHARTVSIDS